MERAGDSTALVFPEDGAQISARTIAEQTARLAAALHAAGVRRGARVAMVLPDGPQFLRALFAVTSLGAAAAPLNFAYREEEFAFYLDDLRPQLLLVPAGEIAAARQAAQGVAIADLTDADSISSKTSGRTQRAGTAVEAAQPDDVALLLHTSGTTSRPKQVPLLHRNLMASTRTIATHYQLTPGDVSYSAMPLFHVHGLVASVFAALVSGGACVVPRRVRPRTLIEHLSEYAVTWFSAGPTLHQMLLERFEQHRRQTGPRQLRFLRSCSSALSPKLMNRLEEHYGVPVLEAYGMTEASHQISSNPLPPEPRMPGSVGVPTGTEIAILDRRGRRLTAGQRGEVAIRGAAVMSGYLNNPQANEEAFKDGWFRTGDLGVINDHGYLSLCGRLKELIIRGGENISPHEVEDALLVHRAVADAACFGIPDDKYGEQVGAAVVLSSDATEAQLITHCRERLAAFKVPTEVHIVTAIPRTATGKLQRQRIPALLGLERS